MPVILSGPTVAPAPVTASAEAREVRIAVAALLSPRRSLEAHGRLFDVLAARLGQPVRVVQRRTYAEVNELLVGGGATLGFVCGGAFVAAEDRGVELLAAPVVRGAQTYYSYLIVRRDAESRSFDDLRGRSFAFTDPLSNSGCLYPSSLLAERGVTAAEFFERVVWSGSHEGSIEAVAHGIVDGAAVDSLVFDYLRERDAALLSATRVLEVSPPFGIQPVVASPRCPPELKARVRSILLGLAETPDGRAALDDLEIDRFAEARPEDYASIRAMRAAVGPRAGR